METINKKIFFFLLLSAFGLQLYEAKAQNLRLSMDEAVSLSLEKNRDLQVSNLETEKSFYKLREAKGSALPLIYAAGNYLYFPQKQVSFLPGSFIGQSDSHLAAIRVGGENSFIGSVNIVQPILKPDINSRIRSEKVISEMVQEEKNEVAAEVVTEVKKAYLHVLITNEQLKLQEQSIERNKMALKDARSMLAQGRASRVDTLRAFVNIENLRPEVMRLTNAVEIGKTVLKRIIGLDESTSISLKDSLILPDNAVVLSQEDAMEEALKNRPEIRRMRLNTTYNNELISLESAERLPDLAAVGTVQVQTQANDFNINEYAWPVTSYVGLQLNVPLFSGLKNSSRIKQAQISLQQSEKQLDNSRELVRAEIKINLSKIEEAWRRTNAQQQTISSAELGYKITRDRWKQGIASRLELSDAELSLTQAKSNYLQAVYDYLVADIELNRSLGSLNK